MSWLFVTGEKSRLKTQVKTEILRSFEIYVFPKIGSLPHDKTRLHVWLSLIEDVIKEKPSIS
ncbi:MAG TPA: hypothetical protein ACHBX0_09500, partial [Arsenophonus sp.]